MVVVCGGDQQAAGGLVSVGERGGQADGRLLQSAPPQLLTAAWTFLWNREAEDLLLAVTQTDHAGLHGLLLLLLSSSLCLLVFAPLFLLFISSRLFYLLLLLPCHSLSDDITTTDSGLSGVTLTGRQPRDPPHLRCFSPNT